MGIIPLVITNMRLITILFALVAAVANAKKVTNGVNIEIKCIEMPKRRERVAWPDQPKDTILDFEKLETLKKNLETKNAAAFLVSKFFFKVSNFSKSKMVSFGWSGQATRSRRFGISIHLISMLTPLVTFLALATAATKAKSPC